MATRSLARGGPGAALRAGLPLAGLGLAGLGVAGLALAGLVLAAGPAAAGSLSATVRNGDGDPVADAVVFALPLGPDGRPAPDPGQAVIDQVDKEFVPHTTAIPAGTAVHFPNHDQIRHHVYSFSDAKTFEIPLYAGTPAEPIVFDQPGVVTLGCNIHDWMKAYVFVTDTPYTAVTDDSGRATLEGVPPGEYGVRVWHARLDGEPEDTEQRVSVGADGAPALKVTIEEKRVWRPRRSPSFGGDPRY